MLIHKRVRECDFTGKSYNSEVDGIAVLAQGATGRWCEVMWGGPEWKEGLEKQGVEILTREEAISQISHGYVDF